MKNEKTVPTERIKRCRSPPCPPFVDTYAPYSSGVLQRYKRNKYQDQHKTHWDFYYKRNTVNGYKDRHYILREFLELKEQIEKAVAGNGEKFSWMEAGCGVGNAFLPIFTEYGALPQWEYMLGFDISSVAIDLLENKIKDLDNALLRKKVKLITLNPCEEDIFSSALFSHPKVDPVSFMSMVFVLCSIPVDQHPLVLQRLAKCMKKGGTFFFRDYGVSDHAEGRFRLRKEGNSMATNVPEENTFTRTNGTLSHFFSLEEVRSLFTAAGFREVQLVEVEREVQNTKLNLNLERKFIQGRFILE